MLLCINDAYNVAITDIESAVAELKNYQHIDDAIQRISGALVRVADMNALREKLVAFREELWQE
jgi:hypothetical protein